jgi:curli biogenesis system outer membrane secretion channel CsgG
MMGRFGLTMKKVYILLVFIMAILQGQTKTIAVLDFDGDGVSQSETRTLTNRLRDEMFKTGVYIVLERGKMDEVLKEQGFQQVGCITSECAVQVGRMLGVQQMVAGRIGYIS